MAVETIASVAAAASDTDTGAPSHGTGDWHQIDWYHTTKTVRRLQARIVVIAHVGSGQDLAGRGGHE